MMVPCEPWNTSGAPLPLVTEHASCIVQSRVVDVHEERVGDLAILLHVDAAARGHAHRELRPDGHQDRRDRVVEEVGRDAARVVPVLAPPEVPRRIPVTLRRVADERLPVEVGRIGVGIDLVVPLVAALRAVAPEAARRPDHLADQPVLDRLLRLVEVIERGVLAADLQDAAARLDVLGDLARLVHRVGHRLLEVDVLAGLERRHRVGVVPVIG